MAWLDTEYIGWLKPMSCGPYQPPRSIWSSTGACVCGEGEEEGEGEGEGEGQGKREGQGYAGVHQSHLYLEVRGRQDHLQVPVSIQIGLQVHRVGSRGRQRQHGVEI